MVLQQKLCSTTLILHRRVSCNVTNSRSSSVALKLLFSEDQTQVGDIILHDILHLGGVQVRVVTTEVLQWDTQWDKI